MKLMKQIAYVLLGVLILNACSDDSDNDNIVNEQPTSFELSKKELSLVVGGREKLLVITPANLPIVNAVWSAGNKNIVDVDKDGIITAYASGNSWVRLSVGSESVQCEIDVIESPISGLAMPQINYPIAKNAKIIIMGSGFKEGDKILLQKITNTYDNKSLKSSDESPEYYATIAKQNIEEYTSFTTTAPEGWYSVLLENEVMRYNLGNIQIETPNIPEFTFDPNVIYWDDTHWRKYQLRGKVKEIKVGVVGNRFYTNLKEYNLLFKFHENGFLDSIVAYNSNRNPTELYSFSYDNLNRVIAFSRVSSSSTTRSEYTYGSHDLYIPDDYSYYVDEDGYGDFNSLYWGHAFNYSWAVGGYSYYNSYFIKSLTNIKVTHSSNLYFTRTTFFDVLKDTVIIKRNDSRSQFTDKELLTYQGSFPLKRVYNYYAIPPEYPSSIIYEFSSNGMLLNKSGEFEYSKDDIVKSIVEFFEDAPYCVFRLCKYTNSSKPDYTENTYDQNWNWIHQTYFWEGKPYSIDISYMSYDKHGNWTQCFTEANLHGIVEKITREITYW